jgi:hypothetical protein
VQAHQIVPASCEAEVGAAVIYDLSVVPAASYALLQVGVAVKNVAVLEGE